MKMRYRFNLWGLAAIVLLSACSDEAKKPAPVNAPVTKLPVIMQPFRFHKLIEVSPGQDYDILSWGRGSSKAGAYMILHSDSAAAKYTTTTGDLDGAIVDVYNSDMDLDGNPEILIQTKGKDTINYTNIYAFEFGGEKARKLDFPKLTKSQKKGYRGEDNFYIKDGALMREFPIYDGNTTAAKPTGAKRQLQYGLRNNEFTVKQLSKDSTTVADNSKVLSSEKKTKAPEHTIAKKSKKHSSAKKSKKHVAAKHKKKHRKHHSREE